jgi:hypothetical protein
VSFNMGFSAVTKLSLNIIGVLVAYFCWLGRQNKSRRVVSFLMLLVQLVVANLVH